MAKFPIYTTERSVPGTSGSTYQRFGGEQVGQAMQQGGNAVSTLGHVFFRKQGETELMEVMAQDTADMQKLLLDLAKDPDEMTYEQRFTEAWSGIQNREVKNGWARRERSLRLPALRERNAGIVAQAVWQRGEEKFWFQVDQATARATETGNISLVEAMVKGRLDAGEITEQQFQEKMRLAERTVWAAIASNNPDEVLGLDTWNKFKAKAKYQVPEDYRYFQGLASSARNTTVAKANMQRNQAAAAFESEATISMLSGVFDYKDEDGTTVNYKQAIIDDPNLTPAKRRMLDDFYDEQVAAFKETKPYNELQQLEAHIEISREKDPAKFMKLIRKHAAGLGAAQVEGYFDKRNNPGKDYTDQAAVLDDAIGAMRTYRVGAIKKNRKEYASEKDVERAIAGAYINSLRMQNRVLDEWDAHEEWTYEQRTRGMEDVVGPLKEEIGKDIVLRYGWPMELHTQQGAFGGGYVPTEYIDGIPPGLEANWDAMSEEERATARKLISQGFSIERIKEALK